MNLVNTCKSLVGREIIQIQFTCTDVDTRPMDSSEDGSFIGRESALAPCARALDLNHFSLTHLLTYNYCNKRKVL